MTEDEIIEVLKAEIDDVHNGNATDFAREHGVCPSYVCGVLKRRYLPGGKILDAIGYEKQISYVPVEKP